MTQFPHLELSFKGDALKKLPRFPQTLNPRTEDNLKKRVRHGEQLRESIEKIKATSQGATALSLFLQIDPQVIAVEHLRRFDIEVVAELEDGFILGSSADADLSTLKSKIERFLKGQQKNIAGFWSIDVGKQWKLEHILSPYLHDNWPRIIRRQLVTVDVGIACVGTWELPEKPRHDPGQDKENYQRKLDRWNTKCGKVFLEWDQLYMQREALFADMVAVHGGEILSELNEPEVLPDSFVVRVRITGKGLSDLVHNFPFIFDVRELEDVRFDMDALADYMPTGMAPPLPPDVDAPRVCIIDSGVQEAHPLIAPAIDSASSYSCVDRPTDTADYVAQGGHGTKVAGLVLYHDAIPYQGQKRLGSWIQNVRVLDDSNHLPANVSMAETLLSVVTQHGNSAVKTRIFNHSINSVSVSQGQNHMSVWAATMDGLSWNHDALFVVSAGNVLRDTLINTIQSPGYPDLLFSPAQGIANPAESLQAITVGAVAIGGREGDWVSIASHSWPSSYTRSGPGIWNTIKPEVVEYAGDWGYSPGTPVTLVSRAELSIPVITSTLHGDPPMGYDIGTSFAAAKVSHILAQIEAAMPYESSQLYRALLIQSAAWPEWTNSWAEEKTMRTLGYGIPDADRAISNTEHRITFITKGSPRIGRQSVHIYDVQIPPELQNPSEEYDILIQITLAYKAQPRITRRGIRGYLSTWLTWRTSGRNETRESFLGGVMRQTMDLGADTEAHVGDPIPWMIRERSDWGLVKGFNRDWGTVQKDWATVKSHELPKTFSIAVIGHKGWGSLGNDTVPYSLVVSFEAVNQDVPMYSWISVANQVEVTERTFGM